MAKLFSINERIRNTGIIIKVADISSLSKIRFVTENAGPTNAFTIKSRINGESDFNTSLATIIGDADRLVTVESYDEIQIECTVYDSTSNHVKLLGTGYIATERGVQRVADATERLNLSPSDGDLVLQLDTNTLYVYDEPTTSWINTAGSASAADVSFDNTGTNLSGSNIQDVIEELDVRTYGKIYNAEAPITLNAGDISNKYIILTDAPTDKDKTRVSLINGVDQEYGTDFIVTNDDAGKRLSWNGLNLESLLVSGDILLVSYN